MITRIRVPSAAVGCCVTQSSAAMTWLTSVLPSVVASLSDSSTGVRRDAELHGSGRASGSTPRSGFAASCAAMMPAMMRAVAVGVLVGEVGPFASIDRSGP